MIKKITIDDIKNINHMEFCIPTPGLHIVTGKNGSGKTTLFTCLSRYHWCQSPLNRKKND